MPAKKQSSKSPTRSTTASASSGAWAEESFGRLVYRLERHRRMHYDEAVKPFDLTSPHVPLLAVLWEGRKTGCDTQASMAQELNIDPATVTRGLRRLLELGYIRRGTSERDSRAHVVTLTATGLEVAKVAWDATRVWNKAIAASAGDLDEDALRQTMRTMLEGLQAKLGHKD